MRRKCFRQLNRNRLPSDMFPLDSSEGEQRPCVLMELPLAAFVQWISPKGPEVEVISRQIANAHTTFNVVMTIIWIPLVAVLVRIVMLIIPDGNGQKTDPMEPVYLDEKIIGQPAAALQLVAREVMHCGSIVEGMLQKIGRVVKEEDKKSMEQIREEGNVTMNLYDRIMEYLANLFSAGVLTEQQATQTAGLMYVLSDIDRLGVLTVELADCMQDKIDKKYKYSGDAMNELYKSLDVIQGMYGDAMKILTGDDSESVRKQTEMGAKVFMNRELSWLKFNERVLEEAENPEIPLCERLTFASIYQSNLDEFFMVRVGSLIDQMLLSGDIRDNKTNLTPKEQLQAVLPQVERLNRRKDAVYVELLEALEPYGIKLVNFQRISQKESDYLEQYFEAEIAPLISPTIIGKRQPFPFLKNKEIYAVVALESKSGKEKLGIIPCGSGVFKRLIELHTKGNYMLSEELILHFMPKVFKGYHVKEKSLIRITRNADIDDDALYDEDLDYRDFMADLIKRRKKLAPVRLELSRELDGEIVETLCDYLELEPQYIFQSHTPLDLSFVFEIQDALRRVPELFYEKRVPQKSSQFDPERSILEQIKEKDKLLSFPFESMKPFLSMLREAANDKDVISIKMTLYRVARQSKIVEALIEAAENGKEVLVLVELKARFDEENNIEWSRRLEDAGCRVIYGLDGYKVHSKLCLITRRTQGQVEYFTQIGTGNYNEKTVRLYTDLSLMTNRTEIGQEASNVFQALAMGETVEQTNHLLVAPKCLQNKVLEMMDEEIRHAAAGEEAYIGLKMNSLTDKKIMDKLIEASCAGVKIDMVIRGICCLIPGIPGKTENIRVRSIVGRFLEHSRIYIFGTGEREKVYIASADFMTRNTLRRVEVAAPVYDADIKARLKEMFAVMQKDTSKARIENNKGEYRLQAPAETPVNSQEFFYEQAYR